MYPARWMTSEARLVCQGWLMMTDDADELTADSKVTI